MPAQFENGEKRASCKILPTVHKIPKQFETVRSLMTTYSLQTPHELDVSKILRLNRFRVFIRCYFQIFLV